MACHGEIATHFRDGVFFALPASPWLRGTNENTNGLLRQYFPKGSDLRRYTLEHLKAVEKRVNGRPRKVLGWSTPTEVFTAALAE
jgi:IS30 family transposase